MVYATAARRWVVHAFACKLGKIPPRGDLFQHMRDLRERDEH